MLFPARYEEFIVAEYFLNHFYFFGQPFNRKKFGSLKWLCSFKEGPFKEYCAEDVAEIKKMESYRGHQFFVKPGSKIRKTTNCFTWVGCVRLTHEDEDVLKRDMARYTYLARFYQPDVNCY